jgi:RNA polymerase sigma factor (sigma-70 family)
VSSPTAGDPADRFRHDRAWLDPLLVMADGPGAFAGLERRLRAWLAEFRKGLGGVGLPNEGRYLDRAWACWAWHWQTALAAGEAVDGFGVADQVRRGRGFTGRRDLGGDPIFDVLLATAFVDRRPAAIDAFCREHQPFCLGVAGKVDRRLKEDDDWWPEFLEELGGFAPRADGGARRPKLDGFRGRCALRNWLGTVVRHYLHDRRAGRAAEDEGRADAAETSAPGNVLAAVMSADCKRRLSQIMARLRDALQPRDRLLLDLLLVDRLAQKEAAAVLKIHPGNVTRSLERIIKQLRAGWDGLPAREKGAADDCYPELTTFDWLDILADLSGRPREGPADA